MRVTACERAGSQPWLKSLSSNLAELRIETTGITEEPYETSVVRHYTYRIGWRELPTSLEFNGKLWAESKLGEKVERTEVCELVGTRSRQQDFRPAVARLTPAGGWRDVIVFRHTAGGREWRIAPEWTAPPWLALEWHDEGDSRLLRIAARDAPPSGAERRLIIPLASADGRKSQLPVEIAAEAQSTTP